LLKKGPEIKNPGLFCFFFLFTNVNFWRLIESKVDRGATRKSIKPEGTPEDSSRKVKSPKRWFR